MREMAKKRGITILELNTLSEHDTRIDHELDQRQIHLGKTEDNFIIDGRLSFHFIPHAIKIFLTADTNLRVHRIFKDQRKTEKNSTLQDTLKDMCDRQASEQKRYRSLYHLDYLSPTNYDFVLDTTTLTIAEVGNRIISFIKTKKFK